jgi:flagellar assembly protein FliH
MAPAFEPLRDRPDATPFSPAFLVPMPAAAHEPQPAPPQQDDPDRLEAALHAAREAARAEAFEAGRAAGRAEAAAGAEARLSVTLESVAATLAGAREMAFEAVGDHALALARLILATLDAALPQAAARHAPDLVLRLVERLRPAIEDLPGIRLHVSPDIAAEVEARAGQPWLEVVADAAVAPGDAQATWRGGAARLDLAARRAAIRMALAEAGIGTED